MGNKAAKLATVVPVGNKAAKLATVVPVGTPRSPPPPPLQVLPKTAAQRRAAQAAAAEEQMDLDVQWGSLSINIQAIQEDDYGDIFSALMRIIIAYYLAKKAYSDAMAGVTGIQRVLNTRKSLSQFVLEKAKGELREVRSVLRRAERKEGLVAFRAAAARADAAVVQAAAIPRARIALTVAARTRAAAQATAVANAQAAAARAATDLADANARALPENLKNKIRVIVQRVSDTKPAAAAAAAIRALPAALETNDFERVVAAVEAAARYAAEDTVEVAINRQLLEEAIQNFDNAVDTLVGAQAALNALAAGAADQEREDAVAEKEEADEALEAAKIERDAQQAKFDKLTDTPAMAEARAGLQEPAAALEAVQERLAESQAILQAAEAALAANQADQALIAERDAAIAARDAIQEEVAAATAVRDAAQAALDRASDAAAQAEYKSGQVAALADTNAVAAGPAPHEAAAEAEAAFVAATERIKNDMGEMMGRIGFNPDGISFLYTLVTAFFDDAAEFSIAEQYAAKLAARKFLLPGRNLRRDTLAGLLDIIIAEDFTGRIDPKVSGALDQEADLPAAQNADNISHLFQTVIKYPEFMRLRTGWSEAYSGVEGFPVALEQRAILCARRVWGTILSVNHARSTGAVGRVEVNERQMANQQELDSFFKGAADNIRLPNMDDVDDLPYILLKSILTYLENNEEENVKASLSPIFKDERAKELIARMIIEFCKIKESTQGEAYLAFISSTLFTLMSDTGSNQAERDIFNIAAHITAASPQLSLLKTPRVSQKEIGEAERRGINTGGRLQYIVNVQEAGGRPKDSLRTVIGALFVLCKYPTNIDNLFSGWKRLYEIRDDEAVTVNNTSLGNSLRAVLCARRVWVCITTIHNYQKGFAEELEAARRTRFTSIANNSPTNLQARGDKLKGEQMRLLSEFIRMSRLMERETGDRLAALEGRRTRLLKDINTIFQKRTKFLKGYYEWANRKFKDALTSIDKRGKEQSRFIGADVYVRRFLDAIRQRRPLPPPIPYRPATAIPDLKGNLATAQDAFRQSLTNTGANLDDNPSVKATGLKMRKEAVDKQLHDTYQAYLMSYRSLIEENVVFQIMAFTSDHISRINQIHEDEIKVIQDTDFAADKLDELKEILDLEDRIEEDREDNLHSIERDKVEALTAFTQSEKMAEAIDAADVEALRPPVTKVEAARPPSATPARGAIPAGDARMAAARARAAPTLLRPPFIVPAGDARVATARAKKAWGEMPNLPPQLEMRIGRDRANANSQQSQQLPTAPRRGPWSVSTRGGRYIRTKKAITSRISKKHRRRLTKNKRRSRTSLKRATRNKK